jgi:hypothetical protein
MSSDNRCALPPEEILRLQALGDLVRRSHDSRERAVHIDTLLLVARQHRDAGVRWAVLARAIGISSSTLRRWRLHDRPAKPISPDRATVTIPGPNQQRSDRHGLPARHPAEVTGSLYASQSQHANQTTTANQTATTNSHAVIGLSSTASATPGLPPRRRILVLTGDPRPGGNTFDPEVASIRDCLHATSVRHRHVTMIGLDEIATVLDQERPAVLHVCAHHALAGLPLSLDGRPHWVSPDDLAAAIGRSRHRPRCAVLSFCSSLEIASHLARRIPAVVAWPGPVEDEQAACCAGRLYRHIAAGTTLPAGVTEAGQVVATRWPELRSPALYGRWRDAVL